MGDNLEEKLELEKRYRIKDLPLSERPREKLVSHGVESLSNAELLALIIKIGNHEETAVQVAQNI